MRPITLANPLILPLGIYFVGGIGLIGFQAFLGEPCIDNIFYTGFIFGLVITVLLIFKWAKMLEQIDSFAISKIPSPLIIIFVLIKIYIAATLIFYGEIEDVNVRLDAYGSSTLIMVNTVLYSLFFPICFFAAKSGLIAAPSKSSIVVLFFSILFYYFILFKLEGKTFKTKLISLQTFGYILVVAMVQITHLIIIYDYSFVALIGTLANRIANNFDSAIYACMISEGRYSPDNFLVYTLLPVLKRIDSGFYNLDFYNVSQWLLYEALNISRYGRTGFPNDNLFVGLYFGGFGLLAIFVFVMIILMAHYFFSSSVANIRRTRVVNPLRLALLINLPLIYQSTQEFFGFIILLLIFFLLSTAFGILGTGYLKPGSGCNITSRTNLHQHKIKRS